MTNSINSRQSGKNNQNAKTGGRDLTHDIEKQQVAEILWLHYFNKELYERGIITEIERNKMAFKIESNKPLTGVQGKVTGYK